MAWNRFKVLGGTDIDISKADSAFDPNGYGGQLRMFQSDSGLTGFEFTLKNKPGGYALKGASVVWVHTSATANKNCAGPFLCVNTVDPLAVPVPMEASDGGVVSGSLDKCGCGTRGAGWVRIDIGIKLNPPSTAQAWDLEFKFCKECDDDDDDVDS